MRAAATAERDRIERERERLGARERVLRDELRTVTERQEELHSELEMLRRFTAEEHDNARRQGGGPRLHIVDGDMPAAREALNRTTVLRGAPIRERAVAVLAASGAADQAVHYRTWFELLVQHGYTPAGKDPVATFLTQIGRSPVVKRATNAGIYALDLDFPDRARARLIRLRDELAQANSVPTEAAVEELGRLRDRRQAITAEMGATERALDEALRSLSGGAD